MTTDAIPPLPTWTPSPQLRRALGWAVTAFAVQIVLTVVAMTPFDPPAGRFGREHVVGLLQAVFDVPILVAFLRLARERPGVGLRTSSVGAIVATGLGVGISRGALPTTGRTWLDALLVLVPALGAAWAVARVPAPADSRERWATWLALAAPAGLRAFDVAFPIVMTPDDPHTFADAVLTTNWFAFAVWWAVAKFRSRKELGPFAVVSALSEVGTLLVATIVAGIALTVEHGDDGVGGGFAGGVLSSMPVVALAVHAAWFVDLRRRLR